MPTFCRHNRFIERCPICSKTLPGNEPSTASPRRAGGGTAGRARGTQRSGRGPRSDGLTVRREGRALEDGYSSPLVPGLRASADAQRLADEIAFSSARLAALAAEPAGLYEQAFDAAADGDLDRASWTAFVLAYLSPSEDESPFAGAEAVLAAAPAPGNVTGELAGLLDSVARGPRSSHRPGSGTTTLSAYAQWAERSGGQAAAFTGDAGWTPERRFARVFERLALPGLSRGARYELLVSLGRLGVYEVRAESLGLGTARGTAEDETALAAKRVFGIGDPLLLDRRAGALAEAGDVPLEALDLALFNWSRPPGSERATLAFRPESLPQSESPALALAL
jgi:hypothetical protein